MHTRRRALRFASLPLLAAVFPWLLAAGPARAADAHERKFIRQGMPESEVLLRIGPPDHESLTSGGGAEDAEKVWSYFPHSRDTQTLTVITLRAGRVLKVERRISR